MLQSLSLDNPRLVQQSLSWYVRACVKAIHGTCRERARNHVASSLPMFSQAQLLIQIDAYAHSTTRMDKKGNQHIHAIARCVGSKITAWLIPSRNDFKCLPKPSYSCALLCSTQFLILSSAALKSCHVSSVSFF